MFIIHSFRTDNADRTFHSLTQLIGGCYDTAVFHCLYRRLISDIDLYAVIVLTGSNAAYASALGMLQFGRRLVVVGIPEGDQHLIAGATPIGMIFGGKQIVGVGVGNRKDAIECLDMVSKGIVKVHFRTEKMEKLQDVFEEMEAAKLLGRVVLDLS